MIQRTTPLPRRRAKPRRKAASLPCSWSNRCKTVPRVIIDDEERYCKKHARKVADQLVGDQIKARDRWCVKCGSAIDLEYAHIHSRGMRWVQYDLDAAVTLCKGHHYYFTNNSAAWVIFVEENWPGLWTRLLHREMEGLRSGIEVDLADVIVRARGLTPEDVEGTR